MKKLIVALLVPCLLLQLYVCHSMKTISKESLPYKNEYPRLLVLTSAGSQIEFEENKYTLISDTLQGEGMVLAIKKNTQPEPFSGKIPLSDIQHASAEQFDIGGTLLVGSIIVALIAFIISSNVPFNKK